MRNRKLVAVVTAVAYLTVFGVTTDVGAQEESTTLSADQHETTQQKKMPVEGVAQSTERGEYADRVIDTSENRDSGDMRRQYQGVRRGAGASTGTQKKKRKLLIDTSDVEQSQKTVVADTLALADTTVQVEDIAPGVTLSARGKKIALAVSAGIVVVITAVVYFMFLRSDDSSGSNRIPPPPDPPGV